jgi:hypothetical protein
MNIEFPSMFRSFEHFGGRRKTLGAPTPERFLSRRILIAEVRLVKPVKVEPVKVKAMGTKSAGMRD